MNIRSHPCFVLPLLAAGLLLTLAGCHMDNPGEDTIFPQTSILRVEVEPSPVPQGQTATFTAVIEDSTDQSFDFIWFLDGPTRVTEESDIQWSADFEPGSYTFAVRADNGSTDERSVSRRFDIEIIEQKQSSQ